jgi:hypothetical protein
MSQPPPGENQSPANAPPGTQPSANAPPACLW